MRLISINQSFWSCDNDQNFLIPFAVVDSSDPTDNYLHFEFYGSDFAVEGIEVRDYETGLPIVPQPSSWISSGSVNIDGVTENIYMVRINVAQMEQGICFYVRVGLNPFPDTTFFHTEAIKVFRFTDDCNPPLVRIESSYPKSDCIMHDAEGINHDYILPISQHPNTYATFSDGAKFRNFCWFYGDIAWSETKFTKNYEGFFNTHMRTSLSENYELFLKGIPNWYAKELANVLGGSDLQIWNSNRKLTHEFECTELTLTQDKRSCMVLPSGVKLQSIQKTVLIGCGIDAVLGNAISLGCRNFLNMSENTFNLFYTSGLNDLQVGLNLGYSANVVFSMYAYRSNTPSVRIYEHDLTFTGVLNFNVDFVTLIGFGLVDASADQQFTEDFQVTWVFKISVDKPSGCPADYNTKALNFKTVFKRTVSPETTTVLAYFGNKQITVL